MGSRTRVGLALAIAGATLIALPLVGRAAVGSSEPNDNIPGVVAPAKQPITGAVAAGTTDADDVWAVRIPAGRWFWARLSAPTGSDLDLYLFGPGAKSVRSTTAALAFSERQGSSTEFIRYRASVDTTAYVDVAAYRDQAAYSLRYDLPDEEIALSVKAPSRSAWAGTATIAGSVRRSADGSAVPAGEHVYLFHRPYGQRSFTSLTKALTAEDGSYSFTVKPAKRTTYEVRHLGSTRFIAPVDPAAKTITPYASLTTPSVPRTIGRRTPFIVSGYLRPRHTAGAKSVQVRCYQLQPDGTYAYKHTVMATNYDYKTDSGTITRYRATVSVPSAGRWRFKSYIKGDSLHASTWSPGSRYRTVP